MSYLRFQVVIFGLTFVAATFLVGVDGVCDEAEYKKCLAFLPVYQKSKFTYTAREEAEASCRVFDEFINCANRTGCVTSEVDQAYMKGLKKASDCSCDKRIEVLDALKCLDSQKLFNEFCRDIAISQPDKTPCEKGCLFFSCAVQSVQKCCGKKAGGLISDILKGKTVSVFPNDCQFRSDLVVEVLPLCTTGDSDSIQIFN